MHDLTQLIMQDMCPSLGVTEPGAIAFAVATARQYVSGPLTSLHVALNSGMYKNAFTCGIPNTDHVGFLYAAALGYTAGDASLKLEALHSITPEALDAARELIDSGLVHVSMTEISSEIYICATLTSASDTCAVTIRHAHTNITSIVHNSTTVFSGSSHEDGHAADAAALIHHYTLADLLDYVNNVPLAEIAPIQNAFSMNLALLDDGLSSPKTEIAHFLLQQNGNQKFSENALATAQLLCAGAIEARVLGIGKPAMSITGSGSHGIIATMPLYALAKCHGLSDERLLRATALSMLLTQYIKEYSGKLSAMCGCGVAAGSGMACALTMLYGGDSRQIIATLKHMALSITGMICDGGNHGCALKAITAVDIAFRSANLALHGVSVASTHGICGFSPEDTMRYIGYVSVPGMQATETAILDIFQEKANLSS